MHRKNRLCYWRKVRGLSQNALAQRVGVTSVTISNWERDETFPRRSQVQALAKILRVDPRALYPFEPL